MLILNGLAVHGELDDPLCYNQRYSPGCAATTMDDPASSLLLLFETNDTGSSVTVTEVLLEFLVILVIVGMNAFFVASEFSLVTVRKTRIQKLADEGNKSALAVVRLQQDPTLFISAVQLGVTLASLALG